MRVIKHGDMKPRKFTCLNCGCEFIANTTEYCAIQVDGKIMFWTCECPECSVITSKSELWEGKDENMS